MIAALSDLLIHKIAPQKKLNVARGFNYSVLVVGSPIILKNWQSSSVLGISRIRDTRFYRVRTIDEELIITVKESDEKRVSGSVDSEVDLGG